MSAILYLILFGLIGAAVAVIYNKQTKGATKDATKGATKDTTQGKKPSPSQGKNVSEEVSTKFLANKSVDWLTSKVRIPQYVLDYAVKLRSDYLAENSQSVANVVYEFSYDAAGDACLTSIVEPKPGYSFKNKSWVAYRWGATSGEIGLGSLKYKNTKKNADEAEFRIEERRKDPAFAAIEKVVLKLATDIDYDYLKAYNIKAKYRFPDCKKGTCDDYAAAVSEALNGHPLVDHVEKYAGGKHAWNVVVLKDGRKIYTDCTWYCQNNIDDEGYVVHVPKRNPVNLTFDKQEFDNLGGAIDQTTGREVKSHFGYADTKKTDG